jgi:hypothetical protein
MTKFIKDETNRKKANTVIWLQEQIRITVNDGSDRSDPWQQQSYQGGHMALEKNNSTLQGYRKEPATMVHTEKTLKGGAYDFGEPMKE